MIKSVLFSFRMIGIRSWRVECSMSYFDSRVDKGPVWQVVSIRVVKVEVSVDMVVFVVCMNRSVWY